MNLHSPTSATPANNFGEPVLTWQRQRPSGDEGVQLYEQLFSTFRVFNMKMSSHDGGTLLLRPRIKPRVHTYSIR